MYLLHPAWQIQCGQFLVCALWRHALPPTGVCHFSSLFCRSYIPWHLLIFSHQFYMLFFYPSHAWIQAVDDYVRVMNKHLYKWICTPADIANSIKFLSHHIMHNLATACVTLRPIAPQFLCSLVTLLKVYMQLIMQARVISLTHCQNFLSPWRM